MRARGIAGPLLAAWTAGLPPAVAQGLPQEPAPGAPTAPPGAAAEAPEDEGPSRWEWTVGFDAGLGLFGFANSLYADVRPDPPGDLSDDWSEAFVRPALGVTYALEVSELYGRLSAVGQGSYGTPPSAVVGREASSFLVEDLHLGWRSGTALGESENLLELTLGRAPFQLGHGMLLLDGAGEGGSRGGYWSNARQAWEKAGILRLHPAEHLFEVYYLERDDVPENDTDTRLWGANYELALGEATTLAASYLDFRADAEALPLRDGLEVANLRVYTTPVPSLPGLLLELEAAREENEGLLRADAWTGRVAYEIAALAWTPTLSYRYAEFEGDDPTTERSEAFDPLFPGFEDWGTWWQGEIAGEYFLANSNLVSHQVRLHLAPGESVTGGLIGYLFRLDVPAALPSGSASEDLLVEVDAYCDWEIGEHFAASFVAAYGNPRRAVEQAFGRSEDFWYGMAYFTYTYERTTRAGPGPAEEVDE